MALFIRKAKKRNGYTLGKTMMKCKHYRKAPFPGKHEQCFAYLIMEEEVVVYFLYAVQ